MGLTNPVNGAFVSFPYAGFGVSVLDFLNREEELEVEWKYHEHSAWEIGVGEAALIGASNVTASFFGRNNTTTEKAALTGFNLRVATATVALPVLDYRLSVGTALANVVALGLEEYGIGVLPIRVSYHWQPFDAKFVLEPFVEYNYAPSQFAHLGVRAALPVGDQLSVLFVAGYVDGNTGSNLGFNLGIPSTPGSPTTFSSFYMGFGASFLDRIFSRGELRYGKGYPHE